MTLLWWIFLLFINATSVWGNLVNVLLENRGKDMIEKRDAFRMLVGAVSAFCTVVCILFIIRELA